MPQFRLFRSVYRNHAPGGFAIHYVAGQYLDLGMLAYNPQFLGNGVTEPPGTPIVDPAPVPVLLRTPPRPTWCWPDPVP
jgi:hypothetical protein